MRCAGSSVLMGNCVQIHAAATPHPSRLCRATFSSSLGQDPLRTGPPGLQGPASLTGCPLSEALCLSSLWSLVSDLSPAPPSPSPPLSLSLCLFSLLSLLCILLILLSHPHLPLHLPSSSTFCPMLMVKVTATETSPHLPPEGLWLCPGPQ